MEAGVGGGWEDWSQLGHLAKQPGAWGPGHSQPPQSHPTPLLREPQWVTTRKSLSLAGERRCKGKRCVWNLCIRNTKGEFLTTGFSPDHQKQPPSITVCESGFTSKVTRTWIRKQNTCLQRPLHSPFLPPPCPKHMHCVTSDSRLFMLACMLSHFNCVRPLATLWTVALQAPLSMGFSRQEYWSGLSFPSPGDPPNPGIKPSSLMPPALTGVFFTTSATLEAHWDIQCTPLSCLPSFALVIFKRIVLLVQLVAVGFFSLLCGCSVTSYVFLHPEDGHVCCVHFRAIMNVVALPILSMPLGARVYTLGEGNGTPLQYSCLENPMDRGA